MAQQFNTGISLQDAIGRSHDVYDVYMNQWATDRSLVNPGTLLDAYPALTIPGLIESLAGISIGPKSEVDRCWVSWNPNKSLAAASGVVPLVRPLCVEAPLRFSIAGKKDKAVAAFTSFISDPRNVAMGNGLLYVFPTGETTSSNHESTWIPDFYVKPNGDFEALLGNAFPPDPADTRCLVPTLHLQLILRSGVDFNVKREPAYYSQVNMNNSGFSGLGVPVTSDGEEQVVGQIPTYGRKTIHITMRSSDKAGVTFRVGALRTYNPNLALIADPSETAGYPQEATEGQKTASGTDGVRFTLCSAYADYINLYATHADADEFHVSWTLAAFD